MFTCFRWCTTLALFVMAAGAAAAEPMVFPGKEWEEATPESQGVDGARLKAALDYLADHTGRDGTAEVVVGRNGRMIWKGEKADKVHGVWSVTKSFTSTVLGLLIDDEKCTLDTLAKEHVPGMAEAYPAVTLRHFTTMTSGYRAVGDEPRGGYLHGPSPTPFAPGPAPLFTPPGSRYAYWDSAMNQFANVLARIAGEPIKDTFRRRIAEPTGMNPDRWDWGDFGRIEGIVVNGGSGNHDRHVRISALEMARLGHLYLNRGSWKGRQLLSSGWVNEATRPHVPASLPWAHPESRIDGRGVYGFNWWANGLTADGKRKWPGAPRGTFAAAGYNNNKCFVIPEWNIVVVRLGLDGNVGDDIWSTFFGKLAAAISGAGGTAGVSGVAPGPDKAEGRAGMSADAAWQRISPFFKAPDALAGDLGSYRSPLAFDDGRPVGTPADWRKRREEILRYWHGEMGPWPPLIEEPSMDILETAAREGFTQRKVRLWVAPDLRIEGYLLVPPGRGPFPAVLVVYYDAETGAGLKPGKGFRDFGHALTKRGFVSLSIGWPRGYTDRGGPKLQPLSCMAYIAANCSNALAALPEVDRERIGVVGHSFGGKWALFAAALWEGFACVAFSDPGIVFDEKRPNVNYWEPWYLGAESGRVRKPGVPTDANPRTGTYKRLVEAGRDLHELHALIAPRPFLVSGGAEDRPERWRALNHAVAVNRLLGHENRVAMTNRKGHSPTEESNEQMYLFFEYFLKHGKAKAGPGRGGAE